MYDKIVFKF